MEKSKGLKLICAYAQYIYGAKNEQRLGTWSRRRKARLRPATILQVPPMRSRIPQNRKRTMQQLRMLQVRSQASRSIRFPKIPFLKNGKNENLKTVKRGRN